jgi:hypothetical protein
MENSEVLVLILNSKIFLCDHYLKIYRYNDNYTLVELTETHCYNNNGRRFKDEWSLKIKGVCNEILK